MNRKWVMLLGIFLSLIACNKKYYHWFESYSTQGMNPYDIKIIYDLLDNREGDFEVIRFDFVNKLKNTSNANHIYFSDSVISDSLDIYELMDFVSRGNNSFLIGKNNQYNLIRKICSSYSGNYDTTLSNIEVDFVNSMFSCEFDYRAMGHLSTYPWRYSRFYHDENESIDSNVEFLATVADSAFVFYRIKHGLGYFYFHTNPMMFSNYQLTNELCFKHSKKVFDNLLDGTILWDESNHGYKQEFQAPESESFLKLLFSKPSLKWAWYTTLIAFLLYLLFRSKRVQRVIPMVEKNTNDTVEFTKHVARLYFKRKNHSYIATELYTVFLNDLRRHYGMETNVDTNQLFDSLAKRSGLGKEFTDNLRNLFDLRHNELGTNKELIDLHVAIQKYYKNRM